MLGKMLIPQQIIIFGEGYTMKILDHVKFEFFDESGSETTNQADHSYKS